LGNGNKYMSTQQIMVSDFSKGLRAGTMRVSQQESAVLVNLDHIAGSLATVPVAEVLTPADTAQDTGAIHNVLSIEPYVDAQGLTSYIARRGRCVWIGRPQASYDRLEPGSGVYAQYEMTEDTDPVYDHAGGIAGITLTNVGTLVEQLWSTNVRHFDGYSSYLKDNSAGKATNFCFGSGSFAASAWIRIDGYGSHPSMLICGKIPTVGTGASWGFFVTDANFLVVYIQDGTNNATTYANAALVAGRWYHVAFSYTAKSYPVIYVNGASVAVTSAMSSGVLASLGSTDNANPFTVGGIGTFYQFNGSIGALSVYSAAESGIFATQASAEMLRYKPATNPYEPVRYRWAPLLVDTLDGATIELRSRLYLGRENVEQVGYRAYFSPETPAESDYLMAWDGLIVDKILVTNAGSLVAGSNLYSVSNNPDFGVEGMYQFESAGVRPGDVLIYNPGVWPLQGHVITAVCADRSNGGYGVYTSALVDVGCESPCEAVIVRVRRAGVTAAGSTTATPSTDNYTSLLPGTYKYCWRYGNSLSAYFGNTSIESISEGVTPDIFTGSGALSGSGTLTVSNVHANSGAQITAKYSTAGSYTLTVGTIIDGTSFVITSSGGASDVGVDVDWQIVTNDAEIDVSGWSSTPDWGSDIIEIYRSSLGPVGAYNPYYLLKSIALNVSGTISGATVVERTIPSSYTDDGTDTPDLKKPLLEAVGHEQPGPIANLHNFNSRLYGSDIGLDAMTQELSTLGQYEYWPGVEYDQVSATPTNANIGGAVQLGNSPAEPITAMVPEVGTFITTGLQGSDILVFFPTRALRWSGNTAADFQVSEGVSVGAMNPALAVNAGEYIIWFDGDHFRSLPIGGSAPEIISFQLWPRGFKDYLSKTGYVDVTSIVSDWSACYKNGWYYVACTFTAGNINDTILAYHLASKTWKTYSVGVEDICAGAIIGAANNPNLVGVSSTSDVNGLYNLVNIESGIPSSGYPISFNRISGPINPAKEAEHMRDLKTINKITALMDTPLGNQTVTFSLYANGNLATPVATDSQILLANPAIYNGSPYPGKQIIEWTPPAYSAVVLQVGISGTFTEPANIEWLQVTVETT
jgi:hypothetical protein